jgi:hypothetical protein
LGHKAKRPEALELLRIFKARSYHDSNEHQGRRGYHEQINELTFIANQPRFGGFAFGEFISSTKA